MKVIKFLPKFVMITILTVCFCSCAQLKPQSLIVDESKENHAKIEYKYLHDTVHIQDSSVTLFRNDTIFAEKWHTKYIAKIVKDTVRLSDTVFMTKTVIKTTNPPKPSLKEKVGGVVIASGIIILFLFIFYLLIRLKKWK